MKKIIAFSLTVILIVSLSACSKHDGDLGKQTTIDEQNGYTLVQEVVNFKMNDDERAMKKLDGVQKSGFATTEDNPMGAVRNKNDALAVAKKEVSVSYNSIRNYFDRTQGKWKIVFSNDVEKVDENGMKHVESNVVETVYVDEDGYTLIIYMGEVK